MLDFAAHVERESQRLNEDGFVNVKSWVEEPEVNCPKSVLPFLSAIMRLSEVKFMSCAVPLVSNSELGVRDEGIKQYRPRQRQN